MRFWELKLFLDWSRGHTLRYTSPLAKPKTTKNQHGIYSRYFHWRNDLYRPRSRWRSNARRSRSDPSDCARRSASTNLAWTRLSCPPHRPWRSTTNPYASDCHSARFDCSWRAYSSDRDSATASRVLGRHRPAITDPSHCTRRSATRVLGRYCSSSSYASHRAAAARSGAASWYLAKPWRTQSSNCAAA
jgi:hypothetical protein